MQLVPDFPRSFFLYRSSLSSWRCDDIFHPRLFFGFLHGVFMEVGVFSKTAVSVGQTTSVYVFISHCVCRSKVQEDFDSVFFGNMRDRVLLKVSSVASCGEFAVVSASEESCSMERPARKPVGGI